MRRPKLLGSPLHYNYSVARLSFFVGKGGVGKTTVSAAYAVRQAMRQPRKKTILVSTDPAHSLAAALEQKLGTDPQRVTAAKGHLYAWQIHAEKHFRSFFEPYRESVMRVIESGTLFSRAEIEPVIDSTLPGMAEIAGLLALHGLLAGDAYDEIIVDTAPIGHTLRMFELPEAFSRFLHFLEVAGSRDAWLAARFSGSTRVSLTEQFLEEWRGIVDDIESALTEKNSRVVLVTSPETFSLNEAERTMQQMERVTRLRVGAVVLNRVVRGVTKCPSCAVRAELTTAAQKFLQRAFPGRELLLGEYPGQPLMGVSALAKFGAHVFDGKKLTLTSAAPRATAPRLKPAHWPALATPLTFTLGKGGVGKTTVSAALAFHGRELQRELPAKERTRARLNRVTVCSTDPAPSLDDIFQADVRGTERAVLGDDALFAIEVDSLAEYKAWTAKMRAKIARAFSTETSRGVHVDLSFDRDVFSALLDIVPPGVDEIFAIFKLLDLASDRATLVIDMAPTGHALELLRMPDRMLTWARLLLKSLARHRTLPLAQDVAVEIASLSQRVRELVKRMQDPERSRAMAVTLAEPMPLEQTLELLSSLDALEVETEAIFINRALLEVAPLRGKNARGTHAQGNCLRCQRARRWQLASLNSAKKKLGKRSLYVLPNMKDEIAGRERLTRFTEGDIWKM